MAHHLQKNTGNPRRQSFLTKALWRKIQQRWIGRPTYMCTVKEKKDLGIRIMQLQVPKFWSCVANFSHSALSNLLTQNSAIFPGAWIRLLERSTYTLLWCVFARACAGAWVSARATPERIVHSTSRCNIITMIWHLVWACDINDYVQILTTLGNGKIRDFRDSRSFYDVLIILNSKGCWFVNLNRRQLLESIPIERRP